MIQAQSRAERTDGMMTAARALRCSDVDDPAAALGELEAAELVRKAGGMVELLRIEEHIPPPSVRDKAKRDKERKRRQRLHEAGDHSTCYIGRCSQGVIPEPTPSRVKSHVTPGLDGTELDGHPQGDEPSSEYDDQDWLAGGRASRQPPDLSR